MDSKVTRSFQPSDPADQGGGRSSGGRGHIITFGQGVGGPYSTPLDSTRLGMVASVMLVAGGLYWISATGLLTASALQAFSPMMWGVGMVLVAAVAVVVYRGTRSGKPQGTARYAGGETNAAIQTTYDAVTGLPTQRLFLSLLNQAVPRAHKQNHQVALLLVEMDHFSLSTELQGQMNINLIYRVQAARVKSALRSTDTVARLADRTFAVLLDQIGSTDQVISIASKMQGTVSLPFTVEGHEVFLTSRIGISLSSQDGMDAAGLLRAASEAVGKARAEGHSVYGLQGSVAAPQASASVAGSSSRASV
ncbi:MAG: GGDEF domain-containing protein [Nitrospiraceae bacterium]|nr:GGDEF domain-containing protein [Nitrospiraceae bacterium]